MLASQLKIMNPLIILPMTKIGRKGICSVQSRPQAILVLPLCI